MICRICYYRIHDGQSFAMLVEGGKHLPVHTHHAAEGAIKVYQVRHNVYDEIVEDRAVRL